MPLTPRTFRWMMNLYPPYLLSRTRVLSVSPDFKDVVVELAKSLLTKNYVGTTFGGSLYAASDPFLMLMLIQILGIKNHVIWDKAASIEFLKPARSNVLFHFKITDADLEKIHQDLNSHGKSLPEFTVEGRSPDGEIYVRVKKILYVRNKSFSKKHSPETRNKKTITAVSKNFKKKK